MQKKTIKTLREDCALCDYISERWYGRKPLSPSRTGPSGKVQGKVNVDLGDHIKDTNTGQNMICLISFNQVYFAGGDAMKSFRKLNP